MEQKLSTSICCRRNFSWNFIKLMTKKMKKKSANKKIIKLLEMKNKIKPSFHANVFPELSCELLPAKDGERINKWKYNVNSPIGTVMAYVHQMLLLSSSRHKHSLLTYLQSKRPRRLPQPHILIQQLGPLRWYGGDYTRNSPLWKDQTYSPGNIVYGLMLVNRDYGKIIVTYNTPNSHPFSNRKKIITINTIFPGTQIELFFGYDINLRAPVTGLRFWVYTLHQMLA